MTATIRAISKACLAALLIASIAGCSSWDSMSRRQKTMVGGAALGGVAGAVISGGGVLATVGGAAIGGVVGDLVGK
jgi:osmotically inducible lipoprotein OsmB